MTVRDVDHRRHGWCPVCATLTTRAPKFLHAVCEALLDGMAPSELAAAMEEAERCQARADRGNDARRAARWGTAVTLYQERITALGGDGNR